VVVSARAHRFIPQEDQGYVMVIIQAPPGSSLVYTRHWLSGQKGSIGQNPDVGGAFAMIGFSLAGRRQNQGMMFVMTHPTELPSGQSHTTAES